MVVSILDSQYMYDVQYVNNSQNYIRQSVFGVQHMIVSIRQSVCNVHCVTVSLWQPVYDVQDVIVSMLYSQYKHDSHYI